MAVKMVIRGLSELQAKLGQAQARMPKFLQDTTLKAVLYVHAHMPAYPPAPAGSTYRRTGTLGRTVTSLMGTEPTALSRVEGSLFGKVTGIVGTRLSYAPWVIDEDRQTRSHKANGWWTLQKVVRDLRKGIRGVYEKALHDFVEKEL